MSKKVDVSKWPIAAKVALELDLSQQTIRRLIAKGVLYGENRGAGESNYGYRIDPESVKQFKARRKMGDRE